MPVRHALELEQHKYFRVYVRFIKNKILTHTATKLYLTTIQHDAFIHTM